MIVAKQLSGLLLILLGSFVTCREGAMDSTTTPESSVVSTNRNDFTEKAEVKDTPLIYQTKEVVPENSPLESSQRTNSEIKTSPQTVLSSEESDESLDDNDIINIKDLIPVLSNDNVPKTTLEMVTDKLKDDPHFTDENKVTTKQPTELVVLVEDNDLSDTSEVDRNKTNLEPQKKVSKASSAGKNVSKVQEPSPSKNAAIFFAFLEPMFSHEPVYVNLTGIQGYSGRERTITDGCLNLSGLQLTGNEAKEVIWRMSKHHFNRVDLSNNNITEVPPNTFSPVALMVEELRLDGNPLSSKGDSEESSLLRWGGLFHLPELRKLNLSDCGLQDIDALTPWNSDFLEVLDLSGNKLNAVPANLQYFHKLRRLYFIGNPITEIEELPLILLWNLQVLDFTGCSVATIKGDPLRNMASLKEVSFMDNQLTRISDLRLPVSWRLRIYLSGNPWICDSDMVSFIDWYYDSIYDFEYLSCGSPWWLKGMNVAFISEEIVSLGKDDEPDTLNTSGERQQLLIPLVTDRLHIFALTTFVLAVLALLTHLLCARKHDKITINSPEVRDGVAYISIDKKPLCN